MIIQWFERLVNFIPLPCIAGTGFSIAILFWLPRLWLGRKCSNWPTVEGRVIQCEIRSNQVEFEINESLNFEYEYTIVGRTFCNFLCQEETAFLKLPSICVRTGGTT